VRAGESGQRVSVERTRTLPAGALDATALALPVDPGPCVSVRITLQPNEPDAAHRAEVEWNTLAEQARDMGAPDPAIDRAGSLVGEAAHHHEGLVAVITDDATVLAGEPAAPSWSSDGIRYQRLPWYAPLVAAIQTRIAYAVVLVDRTGADVRVVGGGDPEDVDVTEVEGREYPIRKVQAGGWSQRRLQQRAEETWRANARDVAETISDLVRSGRAELVLLGGEERALPLVVKALPHDVAPQVREISATRAADGDEDDQPAVIRRALADVVARRSIELLDAFKEASGAGQAASSPDAVLDALQRAQVDVLLITDDDDDSGTAWFVPGHPELVGRDPGALESLGAGKAVEAPLVDVASWSVLGSGGAVRTVPRHAINGPVAGILRW
jgi:hypothetical protein